MTYDLSTFTVGKCVARFAHMCLQWDLGTQRGVLTVPAGELAALIGPAAVVGGGNMLNRPRLRRVCSVARDEHR